jgi:peptidoglycan hydrolase CwlO-like protein
LDSLSLFNVKALIIGIEKDNAAIEQSLRAQREIHSNISDILTNTDEVYDAIRSQMRELDELKSTLGIEGVSRRRRRRQTEKVCLVVYFK